MHSKMIFSGFLVVAVILAFAFIPGIKKNEQDKISRLENGRGIQFIEGDWSKALAEAKSQHKLIFLDAYASWCGPCKLLKRNTFPNKDAGEFFNSNFINVAIDMEKGDGPSLAMRYGVNAYPTLIITDADGNIVTYTQGYMKPKQLIDFGNYGLSQKNK